MKIRKYLMMLLAVLAIGAVLLCTRANAATVAEGTCGNGLTWTLEDTGMLTISGSGAMADYNIYTHPSAPSTDSSPTTGTAPWYEHRAAIVTVVIEEGITHIGSYAFQDCTALTQITIANTVLTIGEGAFSGCAALVEIVVPEIIPDATGPDAATPDATTPETTVPEAIVPGESVPDTEPVLPENKLPAGLTSIGASAFSGCINLPLIVIPEGITIIDIGTFSGCTALQEITLPASLVSVGDNAFMGCTGLKLVHYAGDEIQWSAIVFGIENTELTRARFQTLCIHTWDAGVVTKEATCGAEGETTYTCSLCQFVRTEPIPITLPHTFGALKKVDINNHKRVCNVCKFEEVTAHSWGKGVVQRVATCGHTGITHYTCAECGGEKTFTSAKLKNHTYDNDCDGTCNVCSNVRRTIHSYGAEWFSDDATHWQVCTLCSEKSEVLPHTWDAEELCVDCRLPNPHVHTFGTDWISDTDSHWHICECGKTADEASHSYGSDHLCTDCGAEDPNKPEPTEPPTEPIYPTPEPPAPMMDTPIIIAIVAMALSGVGMVVFLILKKKT